MNCITIQHCIVRQWAGEKSVSRYNYCIVTEAGQALDAGLGNKRARRGAGAQASVLGRAGERQLGAGWARRRACGAGSWKRRRGAQWARRRAGEQASGGRAGRAGQAGAREATASTDARRAHGAGLAGRWARGLALGCALGALGLFLDPVRLGIFLSHKMNTVHYKINFFSKKKIFIKFK